MSRGARRAFPVFGARHSRRDDRQLTLRLAARQGARLTEAQVVETDVGQRA
jgi:hypothetical protein